MARSSQSSGGKKMQFFDCRAVLPKKGESTSIQGMCMWALKTRVKTDERGVIVRQPGKMIPKYVKNRPEVDEKSKKVVLVESPIPVLEGNTWDFVAPEYALSGYLVSLDVNEYTSEGEVRKVFTLLLKDPIAEEIYKITMQFNNVTYSFLNGFFNLDFGTEQEPILHFLNLRLGKYEGSDGKEYASMFLYRAPDHKEKNSTVSWKYKLNESGEWVSEDGEVFPAVEKVTLKNGSTVSDDSDRQDFCVRKLTEIGQILKGLKFNDDGELVHGQKLSNDDMEHETTNQTPQKTTETSVSGEKYVPEEESDDTEEYDYHPDNEDDNIAQDDLPF